MAVYSTYPFGNFQWKSPVATLAALPASGNTAGDVRVTIDTYLVYVWSGSSWNTGSAGGVGTVTSVGLTMPSIFSVSGSPVTTSGTLAVTLATEVANTVFSGPATGADATPTFRALVAADIPNLSAAKITSGQGSISTSTTGLTVGTGTNSTLVNVTIDVQTASGSQPGLLSAADWTTFNSKLSSAVTSVALSFPAGVLYTVSGSPVTTTGTLTANLNTQTANTVLAGPASGAVATPTFRALVPADIPSTATAKILYVSQDVGNNSYAGTQSRPFLTIQAAITAAEAIAAYYNQVIIKVTPSSGGNGYTENLTFSQQGVCLQAEPITNRSDAAIIKGNIVINLTGTSGGGNFAAASNIVYIKGFVLTCSSGDTLTFSGSTFQRVFLADSYFDNTGTGSAIVLTNTGSSGGTKSTVTAKNCDINNNNATNPVLKVSAGRLFVSGPTFDVTNANASGPAVLVDGASAAGVTCSLDKASIAGQVQVTDNTATVYLTFCSITTGSAAAITTPASPSTGFILCGSVSLTTTATNSITGSGIVVLSGMAKASTGGDIISTVTQSCLNAFPQGQTLLGATATSVTNSLLAIKNGHLTSQQTTAPTSALQTGAGTTASRTLTRCTDMAGNISITTNGTGIAAGAQLIVTFNKAYATAPVIALTPNNANAGTTGVTGIGAYATSSTTTFTINFAVAGVAATAYTFYYQVIET